MRWPWRAAREPEPEATSAAASAPTSATDVFTAYLVDAGAIAAEARTLPGGPWDALRLTLVDGALSYAPGEPAPSRPISFELDAEYGWTSRPDERPAILAQVLASATHVMAAYVALPPARILDDLGSPPRLLLGDAEHALPDETSGDDVAATLYALLAALERASAQQPGARRWLHAQLDDAAGPVLFLDATGAALADAAYTELGGAELGGFTLVRVAGGS